MSEQRKYLGKKRQKIFKIEKSFSQRTPKNLSIEKVNLSPIEHLFSSEEIPSIKSYKLNLNLLEKNEKNSSKIQKHSLINISKYVYDFIKRTIHTTGNEVTSHIKDIIETKSNNQPNQKNIQRRVYDAINVICAVGLIKKNKQEIQFINYKNKENNINRGINLNEEKEEEKSNEIEEKIKNKKNELEEKRKILIKNYLTLKFYEKYNKLNEMYPQRQFEKKLEFPFDLIKYDNSSPIKITSKEDSSRYLLLSNSEFIHLTPYDIIKTLIAYDIFLKMNDNISNVSQNKSNMKKSTKGNSLIDEANYNLDNNSLFNIEQEKNVIEESPKKNKIYLENISQMNYENSKETKAKKSKGEKDYDFVFEYLRNIKSFVDEINSYSIHKKKEDDIESNEELKEPQEEPEINYYKDNINIFKENRIRKNSNFSNWSNLYDDNDFKKSNEELISEIEVFMQNFK